MRVTGINHITLAVSDVERSLAFYRDMLGFKVRGIWTTGAYLEAGPLWLCLSLDEKSRSAPHPDYSHIAFSTEEADYAGLSARLADACRIWKEDKSEGASVYFLDPDGHKLELHMGTLQSRLDHYQTTPPIGFHIYEN